MQRPATSTFALARPRAVLPSFLACRLDGGVAGRHQHTGVVEGAHLRRDSIAQQSRPLSSTRNRGVMSTARLPDRRSHTRDRSRTGRSRRPTDKMNHTALVEPPLNLCSTNPRTGSSARPGTELEAPQHEGSPNSGPLPRSKQGTHRHSSVGSTFLCLSLCSWCVALCAVCVLSAVRGRGQSLRSPVCACLVGVHVSVRGPTNLHAPLCWQRHAHRHWGEANGPAAPTRNWQHTHRNKEEEEEACIEDTHLHRSGESGRYASVVVDGR